MTVRATHLSCHVWYRRCRHEQRHSALGPTIAHQERAAAIGAVSRLHDHLRRGVAQGANSCFHALLTQSHVFGVSGTRSLAEQSPPRKSAFWPRNLGVSCTAMSSCALYIAGRRVADLQPTELLARKLSIAAESGQIDSVLKAVRWDVACENGRGSVSGRSRCQPMQHPASC
jgi:hypothetical protein